MRAALLAVLLCACATSHEAKVAVRQDVREERAVQAAERVQEDRGATTIVVEEFAPQKDEGPSGGAGAFEGQAEEHSAKTQQRSHIATTAPATGQLLRRTTTVVGPVHTVATARVAEREVVAAKTEVHEDIRSETHAGWGFSLWLLALPVGLAALGYTLWRFKPWIP